MRPSVLVFDWDGTLSDSKARIVACLRESFRRLDAEPLDDARLASIIGLGLPESAQTLYPGSSDAFVSAFVQHYRDIWLAPDGQTATLFAGARATLTTLAARGFTLCVATGKSRRGLDRELVETQTASFFAHTRCADETVSKPDPLMLQQLLDATQTPAERTLVIGDSQWDLQMAAAASVAAVAVSYGAQPIDHLRTFHPVACINDISELLALPQLRGHGEV